VDYQEDRETSAGLLRLAVQRMSQHTAALTPICYTVWYEYLAGINPRLTRILDARLKEGDVLDDKSIADLYRRYCSEFSIEMQQNIRQTSQNILGNIRQHAEDARARADAFGGQLVESASSLSGQSDADALKHIISHLQGETISVATSMQGLSKSLEESQNAIEQLRKQLDNARAEALVDPLTGVMNRRGFDTKMGELLDQSRLDHTPLSLAVLDIDHFKNVNDNYGHLFGDQVIRGLAQILKANIKGRDAVARLGGEEFGLLLPETNLEGAQALSEKIRRMMEASKIRRANKNEEVGGITVSIGVTTLHDHEDPSAFYDRADQAMYASKGNGRNRVTVASQ
jgi:diguanylate cyclase